METKISSGELAVDTLKAVLENVKSAAETRDLTSDDAEVIRAAAELYRTVYPT